jgi:LysM repeat protein
LRNPGLMTCTFAHDFNSMKGSYIFIAFICCAFSFPGHAQAKITVEEYISLYKDLAVKEMKNYRIPASITLAQGILESENGNSPLALEANNHFGIKCHKEWTGKTYIQDDDTKDECFRKYQKAEDSYRDHSEFLTTRDRYKSLFDLDITDYKGWAYGLKQAGYATNPRYPEILIRIIEENGLMDLDKVGSRQLAVGSQQSAEKTQNSKLKTPDSELSTQNSALPTVFELAGRGGNGRVIFLNNGVKFILAREGDDIYKVAGEFGIYSWQIRKYNDLTSKDKMEPGQKVYLEKKKGKTGYDFHIVQPGETVNSIARDYGIRPKAICRINGRKAGDKLQEGEKLKLR